MQNHAELFAAITAKGIRSIRKYRCQTAGNDLKAFIPVQVALDVIHGFEIIRIKQDKSDAVTADLDIQPTGIKFFQQFSPIGDIGQGIMIRQPCKFVVHAAQLAAMQLELTGTDADQFAQLAFTAPQKALAPTHEQPDQVHDAQTEGEQDPARAPLWRGHVETQFQRRYRMSAVITRFDAKPVIPRGDAGEAALIALQPGPGGRFKTDDLGPVQRLRLTVTGQQGKLHINAGIRPGGSK